MEITLEFLEMGINYRLKNNFFLIGTVSFELQETVPMEKETVPMRKGGTYAKI